MTQEDKAEVMQMVENDIKFGFDSDVQIFESIRNLYADMDNTDDEWLRQIVSEKFNARLQECKQWKTPTNFQRLAKAFDELAAHKIVALHNTGVTKQDGQDTGTETMRELAKLGIQTIGFCYYHQQDLERAIDPTIANLFIGFDSASGKDAEAESVGQKIVEVLKENGFEVNWNGTVEERIEIKNINWQKVPDDEYWGSGRTVDIFWKAASR